MRRRPVVVSRLDLRLVEHGEEQKVLEPRARLELRKSGSLSTRTIDLFDGLVLKLRRPFAGMNRTRTAGQ